MGLAVGEGRSTARRDERGSGDKRSKSHPYLTFHSKIGRDHNLKYAIGAPVSLQIDGEEERKLSAVVGLAVGEGRSTARRDERGSWRRRVNSNEGGLISSAMTKSKDNKR
ncbi:unnamed protein product [Linum trigynum]|uniref:Uncharacterized protein n=1 Tax=Linum trigynum TaxID=586398 RepID=A0AAV2GU35_9ROSI